MGAAGILILLAIVNGPYRSAAHPECNTEKVTTHLDIAVDLITKAKTNYVLFGEPLDCSDIRRAGHNESGVFVIWPKSRLLGDGALHVFCDMDTDGGGWTVIQRRGNFSRSNDYFFKDWTSYKQGFGDIENDFWLGNDNIFALTNQRRYSVRFDLTDVEEDNAFALYDKFWIDNELSKYVLHISDYSGTAGDSMAVHNEQMFSTKDEDNDQYEESCADAYKGGWWYESCHDANLNGLNLQGKHEGDADGIEWRSWKGYRESLGASEIKIRPESFKKNSEEIS